MGTPGSGYAITYYCISSRNSVTGTRGTLYDSGGEAANYANNESTMTNVACPLGLRLQLTFIQLDIEGSMPSCYTDGIKIFHGGASNTFCGTLSGSNLPHINGDTGSALIFFTADSSDARAGYALNYECIDANSGR
jgi:hypothetical protein